jgi:hypothetical protein
VIVGDDLAHVPRIGEPLALRHAQEEPRQPFREIAADQDQVVLLELMEQFLGRQVLGLQRGVLDTRDVIFFVSVIGFALFATGVIIRNQRAG